MRGRVSGTAPTSTHGSRPRRFGEFAETWLSSVGSGLAPTTVAKYRSYLDGQLLPAWRNWPMVGLFNPHLEITKWVGELHEEHAESSVSAYFALCVLDLFTGARWNELAGQQRHEYDDHAKTLAIREPLKEIAGKRYKGGRVVSDMSDKSSDEPAGQGATVPAPRKRGGRWHARTKTPESTRCVTLSARIAVVYEHLLVGHHRPFAFTSPEKRPWYRSNFRDRFWRPAWDGVCLDDPESPEYLPPILPGFTFHEGRHTHATWLAQDGIPEVARRARLGHRMRGMGRVGSTSM